MSTGATRTPRHRSATQDAPWPVRRGGLGAQDLRALAEPRASRALPALVRAPRGRRRAPRTAQRAGRPRRRGRSSTSAVSGDVAVLVRVVPELAERVPLRLRRWSCSRSSCARRARRSRSPSRARTAKPGLNEEWRADRHRLVLPLSQPALDPLLEILELGAAPDDTLPTRSEPLHGPGAGRATIELQDLLFQKWLGEPFFGVGSRCGSGSRRNSVPCNGCYASIQSSISSMARQTNNFSSCSVSHSTCHGG